MAGKGKGIDEQDISFASSIPRKVNIVQSCLLLRRIVVIVPFTASFASSFVGLPFSITVITVFRTMALAKKITCVRNTVFVSSLL